MTTLAVTLRRRLAAQGSWTGRAALAQGLECSEARLDDELADLVLAGTVMFNERGREYRLVGGALARRALQQLLASPGQRRVLLARAGAQGTPLRMGLALRRATPGPDEDELVMCEIEAGNHGGDPAQVQAMADALSRLQGVFEAPT